MNNSGFSQTISLVFLIMAVLSPRPSLASELAAPWALAATQTGLGEVHEGAMPTVMRSAFDESGIPQNVWVYFADKGLSDGPAYFRAIGRVAVEYNPRAVARRKLRRTAAGVFDGYDLPVSPDYIDAIMKTGAEHRATSRWLNAVSVRADLGQIRSIVRMPFVRSVRLVHVGRRDASLRSGAQPGMDFGLYRSAFYGRSQIQLDQINLPTLHARGYTGQGVIIGVLDTGFRRDHVAYQDPVHALNVIAEWDFVNGDSNTGIEAGDPVDQHFHGTVVLGTLAAYAPLEMVGAAYDADYVLAKVEDAESEFPLEEDWFTAGLEFIEAQGADVATSSLVANWYRQADMDGETSVMAQAFNIATANGVHCLQGAGNAGNDTDPTTSSLATPADAFQVISVGSVDQNSVISWFSSDGPTVDGRVKPEVLARGEDAWSISADNTTTYGIESGTSFSTPQLAGAVACLVQAHPDWTVDFLRDRLFSTADYHVANGNFDPLFVLGHGVADVAAADNVPTSAPAEGSSGLFSIATTHPNPFGNQTRIRAILGSRGAVRLEVFDLRGRRLRSEEYGNRDRGTIELSFNGSDLPNGVHLYRLMLGTKVVARGTMMIVR